MAFYRALVLFVVDIVLLLEFCFAEDPSAFYNFEVSYITASPLGVPQQVCLFFFKSLCVYLIFEQLLCISTLSGFFQAAFFVLLPVTTGLALDFLKFQLLASDLQNVVLFFIV